jgi:hypothetical protein
MHAMQQQQTGRRGTISSTTDMAVVGRRPIKGSDAVAARAELRARPLDKLFR